VMAARSARAFPHRCAGADFPSTGPTGIARH